MGMADIAETAIGHAQGTVNKEFEGGAASCIAWPQCRINGSDLGQCQFAGQYDLRQTAVLHEAGFLRGADIRLCAGMQLDGRQINFQQPHVLNDQRIDAGIKELPGQLAGGFQLVIAQDRIKRDEDAAIEAVRILGQPGNVLHGVIRSSASAK